MAAPRNKNPPSKHVNMRGPHRAAPDVERRIEIACKRLGDGAIAYLANIMMNEEEDTRWRIVAAKEILDRGFGRAKQSIDQKITMSGGEAFLNLIQEARERAAKPSEAVTVEGVVH